MKNLFIFFNLLLFCFSNGQVNKKHVFNVELNDFKDAPTFKIENNIAVYIGNNNDEKVFFSKYTISNFYQTYPSSKVLKSLNMFTPSFANFKGYIFGIACGQGSYPWWIKEEDAFTELTENKQFDNTTQIDLF
jgi:hypothetical protein